MRSSPFAALSLLLLLLTVPPALAQDEATEAPPDTLTYALDPVVVYGTPFTLTTETAPFAVSTYARSDLEVSGNPALSLDRLTYALPGLSVDSREHYALGDRITMRGLGWRAQFGVRGVQAILDGIPLTMADGQSVLDIVDPAFIRTVEAIRGPSSTFWGNSSGGVLYLSTRPAGDDPHTLRARQTTGSYGLLKTDVQVTPDLGAHQLTAYGSHLSQEGYREHSAVRLGRFGLAGDLSLGEGRGVRAMGAYATMPEAESPGSLDRESVSADPQQARDLFANRNAGKASEQGQLGATYYDTLPVGLLNVTGYGIFRDLENPLPFAYITVDRRAGGFRATLQNDAHAVEWGFGVAGKFQHDDRVEYGIDDDGEQIPDQVQVDQLETVNNQAVFGQAALPLGRWRLNTGLRYDRLRFEADNRQVADRSGQRTFQAWSPSVGLTVDLLQTRLYTNLSTALEAPTTTELGNRPDGGGGFNPALDPERIFGLEVGAEGLALGAALSYDVAFFAMQVRDLLLPFTIDDETFHRNEGRGRHVGLEAAVQGSLPHDLTMAFSYTLTRAHFDEAEAQDGTDIDGNAVPGVAPHRVGGSLAWQPDEAPWITLEYRGVSSYFVDSKNTADNDGYLVVNARLSYPGFGLGSGASLQPFLAVNNAFDVRYNSTVVVNDTNENYYESAAGRHWQAGLALQFD